MNNNNILEAIVILGTSLNDDDTISDILKNRAKTAISLYSQNPNAYIICSGAYSFVLDKVPNHTEAEILAEYLFSKKIPKEKIIIEDTSKDTLGNAVFTKLIIEQYNWKHIAIVTSDFHITRACYLFKKVFGQKYYLSFYETKTMLPNHIIPEEKQKIINQTILKEKKIIAFTKNWLSQLSSGDTNSFKIFLFTKHPAYAKNPTLTVKQLIDKTSINPNYE